MHFLSGKQKLSNAGTMQVLQIAMQAGAHAVRGNHEELALAVYNKLMSTKVDVSFVQAESQASCVFSCSMHDLKSWPMMHGHVPLCFGEPGDTAAGSYQYHCRHAAAGCVMHSQFMQAYSDTTCPCNVHLALGCLQ